MASEKGQQIIIASASSDIAESVLLQIHKKRAADQQFQAIQANLIRNYVVCAFTQDDCIAGSFCSELSTHFKMAHPILFRELATTDNVVADAIVIAQNKKKEFADGGTWETVTVIFVSDANHAFDIASKNGSGCFVFCLSEQLPQSIYLPTLIWLPIKKATKEEVVMTAAVWLLGLIQGAFISPYQDENQTTRNILSGFIYDCAEQRMRYDTAKKLWGILNNTENEKTYFANKIHQCFSPTEVDSIAIATKEYEAIVSRFHEELPAGLFRKLLCYISKSYRKKNSRWLCTGIKCGEAYTNLFGEVYATKDISATDTFDSTFWTWWDRNHDELVNTTLAVLIDSVSPNGLLNEISENLHDQFVSKQQELKTVWNEPFAPTGRTVHQINTALKRIEEIKAEQDNIVQEWNWLQFTKKRISAIIESEQLVQKRERYEQWKTQLGITESENTYPVYRWDTDPIPGVSSAKLTDTEDNQFDIDAGMLMLKKKLDGRTGQVIICASRYYEQAQWGNPSSRENHIDHANEDKFTFLDGLQDTDLVLLCMDAR